MNYQMIISYLGKIALFLAPILVAKGILSQEQVEAISALMDKVPEIAVQIAAVVSFFASLYSMLRSWNIHKTK